VSDKLRAYYEANPLMVSSPFGGVDGVHEELFAEVFGRLGIDVAGRRVLDVGCGRGFVGDWVERRGGSYFGADLVVSRPGLRMATAEAGALPFRDDAFGAVFCIDAFEHIPEPGAAAREMRRVLAPGGCLFLSAPNYGNVAGLVKWWCERFGGYAPQTWAPFRRWQPQELEHPLTGRAVRRIFARAGFRRVTRMGYGKEVDLGLCPWVAHPNCPERIKYRLQDAFAAIGPAVVRAAPWASLHSFWKLEA
jgi:ubiquinone/menaquinone biosynthesis C-methylase UbiE